MCGLPTAQDSWNKFDFFLVVASFLDLALAFVNSTFMRVLRIFRLQRLLRTFRLIRKSKVRTQQECRALCVVGLGFCVAPVAVDAGISSYR